MSAIQFLRRINGATGSPATTGHKEGEIAFVAPGAPGAAGATVAMHFFDGAAWRLVNPPGVTPNIKGIAGAGATIEAAFNATNTVVKPGDVIIFTYAGSAYIYTGPASVAGAAINTATGAQFTSLGSATAFAAAGDISTGTDTTKAINSLILRGETLAAPTGGGAAVAGDSDKLVRLNAAGQLDANFIPVTAPAVAVDAEVVTGADNTKIVTSLRFATEAKRLLGISEALRSGGSVAVNTSPGAAAAGKLIALDAAGKINKDMLPAIPGTLKGAIDPTAAPPAGAAAGDTYYASKAQAALAAGWTGAATRKVTIGDMMIFDGTNWHVIPTEQDMLMYFPKAGGSFDSGAAITMVPAAAGNTVIDAGNGKMVNVDIDLGVFT